MTKSKASVAGKLLQAKRKNRKGPEKKPRYCTFCGTLCASAVDARAHCVGKDNK